MPMPAEMKNAKNTPANEITVSQPANRLIALANHFHPAETRGAGGNFDVVSHLDPLESESSIIM